MVSELLVANHATPRQSRMLYRVPRVSLIHSRASSSVFPGLLKGAGPLFCRMYLFPHDETQEAQVFVAEEWPREGSLGTGCARGSEHAATRSPSPQTQLKNMCAVDTHTHIPHIHVHVYSYMHAYVYKQNQEFTLHCQFQSDTHGPPTFCNGENPAPVTFNWAPLCDRCPPTAAAPSSIWIPPSVGSNTPARLLLP